MKYENVDIKMSRYSIYDVYTFFIVRFFSVYPDILHGTMTRLSVFFALVVVVVVMRM